MTTVSIPMTPISMSPVLFTPDAMITPTTNVILHAFDWPYTRVTESAAAIRQAGFKAVLVSPPMASKKSDKGTQWWQRYQPEDYRVIDNQLGNTCDFKRMVNTLGEFGVDIYADVVFNHMANESAERDDLTYPSPARQEAYQQQAEHYRALTLFGDLSEPLFTESDFVTAFPIENWENPWEVQHGRLSGGKSDPGLPTLDHHENVVKKQQSYLLALKTLGVKGFRIDAAKHLTLQHLQAVWTPSICEGMHVFGEIITDGGVSKTEYELFLDPYLKDTRLGAYDFPLFHSIYNAFEKGLPLSSLSHPYSVGEALAFDRAITFTITHDIPNNEVFINQVMSESHEQLAYCYILGRDGGVPLIYSDLDTSGIVNNAGQPRWVDSWKQHQLQQMIAFHNLMHPYPMHIVSAGQDHLLFSRGNKGIVAINRGKQPITLSLPKGRYRHCLDHVNGLREQCGQLFLASNSCAMLVNLDA